MNKSIFASHAEAGKKYLTVRGMEVKVIRKNGSKVLLEFEIGGYGLSSAWVDQTYLLIPKKEKKNVLPKR